jgi:Transposase DDE domain
MHLEIQTHRSSPIGILRSSFRDPETGKFMHEQHGRITGVSLEKLYAIKAALQGKVAPADTQAAMQIIGSKEFGASAALLALAKDIGLDYAIYSKPSLQWVRDVLAMIVGRILFQGSKLSLAHQWPNTALWELCGVPGEVDVDEHCYDVLDRLLERQKAIQTTLAKKHLSNGCLVLYDITSSYFEGAYEGSELVQFGYNRDGKRGHEQIVIGLLTSADGCPVAVEVFPGNTQDAATVEAKIKELQQTYGVKEMVLVGDRGMITQANEDKITALPEGEGIKIISALTHRQMVDLLERNGHQPELFDDTHIVEITDMNMPGYRFCLCRNPYSAQRETTTRNELLERTKKELERIATRKTLGKADKLGAQVGRLLAKTKMGKFIDWSVNDGRLVWTVKEEDVAAAQALDGCYVIKSTVSAEAMSADEVVARYKGLSQVEQAFRHLKTVSLETRPVHHKKDDRIRAHVFLCMLAYYLLWHFMQRLAPMIDLQDAMIEAGEMRPKERAITVQSLLDSLRSIQRHEVTLGGAKFEQITRCNDHQTEILKLLGVNLPGCRSL